MPKVGGITFETQRLDRIIRLMDRRAERLVEETALAVEAGAKANTTRVDTGAMRRGWHATRVDPLLWIVAAGVDYAVYHEFGTTRLAAAPMLAPALEAERAPFRRAAAELFRP